MILMKIAIILMNSFFKNILHHNGMVAGRYSTFNLDTKIMQFAGLFILYFVENHAGVVALKLRQKTLY